MADQEKEYNFYFLLSQVIIIALASFSASNLLH